MDYRERYKHLLNRIAGLLMWAFHQAFIVLLRNRLLSFYRQRRYLAIGKLLILLVLPARLIKGTRGMARAIYIQGSTLARDL